MKLKRNLILIMGLTLFLATACGGAGTENKDTYYAESIGADAAYNSYGYENADTAPTEEHNNHVNGQAPEGLDEQMTLDRKLIKNASLSFETDSLADRKKIVDEAVRKFSAYVEHEEQYTTYDRENVTATIRVPTKHFDSFMEMITQGVGSYDSKTIEVDDVTEEFVDVQARIHTKKELKIRFIALLDKAETIAKIMEIEREITALQAEIESFEGRLKYLSSSVKYATINITYYRSIEVPIQFDNKFATAFLNGWEATVWFFVGIVSIWPFLIFLTTVLLIVKFQLRKRKRTLATARQAKVAQSTE